MENLQSPFINWQAKSGDREAGFAEHRVLIVGQASGTVEPKILVKSVKENEAVSLFGANSLATLAYLRFREHNKITEVDVLPLAEDTAGTVAEGGMNFNGTALEDSELIVRIADDAFKVKVSIVKGDTDVQIASKVKTAIDAINIPFTVDIDAGDNSLLTVKSVGTGAVYNGLTCTQDTRIPGVTVNNITMSGGSGTIDTLDLFSNINERYHTIIFDGMTIYEDVETLLENRFNTTNGVAGGVGFTVRRGTETDVENFIANKNSKVIVVFANVDTMKLNQIDLLMLSEFAAKRALRLTDGAVLGDLVIDPEEVYGGINKSSLPYHNTPMSYRAPPSVIAIERLQSLNAKGLSLLVPANGKTVLGSMITTYKVDNSGTKDLNFKYLNAVDTAMAIQEYLYNSCKKEFGQTRATKGSLVPGVSMTNELSVKGYIVGLYEDLGNKALTQIGREAITYFKKNLDVELDVTTGVYRVYAPMAIVSQFRGLNGVVSIGYNFK